MSDKVALLLEADQIRRERDEARTAAKEIVHSLEMVLEPAAAAKLWDRTIARWPWMKEPDDC